MPKFNRTATVEFAVYGTDALHVTVHNIPYVWDSDLDPHNIEGQAVLNAIHHLRETGVSTGLDCISCVTTKAS